MDPLTALGVASNIIQFLDFATKLVGGSCAIYKSASSASEDNIILDAITSDFQQLSSTLVAPAGCPDSLKHLMDETQRVGQQLRDVLDKLSVKGRKTKWKSLVAAIREIWSQDEVDAITTRLFRLQTQLNTHMQVLISKEIANISVTMGRLQKLSAGLDLRQVPYIRGLYDDFVKSIEKLMDKKLDDVHRGISAANHLADQVQLSDVKELSTAIPRFSGDVWAVKGQMSKTMRDWQLLKSLYFENISTRHDRIAKAHSDTFTWIFKGILADTHEPIGFTEWLRARDDIFWIYGKPGSGKSTLMKFLVHHPDTKAHLEEWANGRKLVISKFFFWHSGTKLQKSQEGLLRSLLFEILRQFPQLLAGIYETVMPSQDGLQNYGPVQPSEAHWDLQELLRAFEYLRGQEVTASFCFFIDGLDEYKDEERRDHRELISVLRDLTGSPHIKLCVSSRPWTVFRDAFKDNPQMTIKLEDLTRGDIRRYVSDSFNKHDQFPSLSHQDLGYVQLVDEVVRKAQGVFLWVFLVVRDLLEGLTYNDTIKTMRARLDRFPEDLDDYFRHIFESIPKVYRVQTARAFQIALSRDEPLSLITYSFVDDVEDDPKLNFNTDLTLTNHQIELKLATMWRRLDGRSRGLLEVIVPLTEPDDDTVYKVEFLHRTVRDFLLCTPDIQEEMSGNVKNKAETWVLLCRAITLVLRHWPQDDVIPYLRQLFYFSRLAIQDGSNEEDVHRVLAELFSPTGRLNASAMRLRAKNAQKAVVFDLFLACEYGLVSYVKEQLLKRLSLLEEVPDDTSSSDSQKSLLDQLLRHALLGQDRYCKLLPELVEYLVGLGASPSSQCKIEDEDVTIPNGVGLSEGEKRQFAKYFRGNREQEENIFDLFLARIELEKLSPNEPGVLDIMKTLLDHDTRREVKWQSQLSDGDVYSQRLLAFNPYVQHVIQKYFTSEQVAWLLESTDHRTSPETEHARVEGPGAQPTNQNDPSHKQISDSMAQQTPSAGWMGINARYPWTVTIVPDQYSPQPLYPIRVDNIHISMILDNYGNIHQGLVDALGEQNYARVVEVVWLGNRDLSRPYGSIVVYLTENNDVVRLLSEGVFLVGSVYGQTRAFQQILPTQCYNCQQIGHRASQCINLTRCSRCSMTGHHHSFCITAVKQCVLCGSSHQPFATCCPNFINNPSR